MKSMISRLFKCIKYINEIEYALKFKKERTGFLYVNFYAVNSRRKCCIKIHVCTAFWTDYRIKTN